MVSFESLRPTIVGILITSLSISTTAASSKAAATTAQPDVRSLERQVEELFRTAHKLPVAISRRNIQVRTTFQTDGNGMISIAEATTDEYTPEQFQEFLQNFGQAFPQINPMARNVIPLEGNPLQKQGVKSVLQFPFPLTDRIMIHWKYLRLNRGPQEHMLILSEQGNQDLVNKYLTRKEREQYVLARTFLCVYWILPRKCQRTGRVQGSCIRYAFSGDTGGTIPAWIQNQVGPKTALDSVQGLLNYVKRQQK